jgi:hypothetical protein
MKIKLTNKTSFRDDDLRKIMHEACARAGVAAKWIVFRVNPGKLHIRGRATIANQRSSLIWGTCTMRIPKFEIWGPGRHGERERTERNWITEICQVALHEAMHLAGVRHKDMTEEQYYCRMPVPWAAEMQLRAKEVAPAVPREERMAAARGDRLEHAQAMLAKAQTRSKRAATIEKKWKRRVGVLSK